MPLPRIYKDQACPLEGYQGLSIRLLVNPSNKEYLDWLVGSLGAIGCEACAKLNTPKTARGKQARPPAEPAARRYCDDCTAVRSRKGRAAVALFGPVLLERPCATVEQALAILDDDDIPADLFTWLLIMPEQVISARIEGATRPNSNGSLTTPST